jgi:hypothetical protein
MHIARPNAREVVKLLHIIEFILSDSISEWRDIVGTHGKIQSFKRTGSGLFAIFAIQNQLIYDFFSAVISGLRPRKGALLLPSGGWGSGS